ncbi:MBL fold metallo-hydrolase [Pseudomarimonas arenosa]|uniref:MBL fold metallo-hydrolase n=1 Tax=Pseudomarimonas arenosa TaxID=2774145 RepID=A0AAW3ZHY9_9GAMM|nr:MBL fold metallo-hydrolase [Pseudomarimonas arenosa]MBD8524317.1 MBL fold metallo-hydrolase [Pseudomarimonas arenosa]
MPFRHLCQRWIAIAVATWAVTLTSAGAQSGMVEITSTDLGHGLHMLQGSGGNIGLSVGDDGVVMIDDQFANLTPAIEAKVRQLSDQPIRFVLNTHWHHDHTGGNENLGKAGAVIVAHHNVRKRMEAGGFMEAFKREVAPAVGDALPVVTFGHDIQFHLNGLTLDARHISHAHTDGDAYVYFPQANVLHTGDLYFNGFYPVIDWGSGGHIDGMVQAVDKLLAIVDDNTKIIPGHGPLSNKAELETYRNMLAKVAQRMNALVADGNSLEQVKAAKPSAEFDATWGNGFLKIEPWVEMVYQGVKLRQEGKFQSAEGSH